MLRLEAKLKKKVFIVVLHLKVSVFNNMMSISKED